MIYTDGGQGNSIAQICLSPSLITQLIVIHSLDGVLSHWDLYRPPYLVG